MWGSREDPVRPGVSTRVLNVAFWLRGVGVVKRLKTIMLIRLEGRVGFVSSTLYPRRVVLFYPFTVKCRWVRPFVFKLTKKHPLSPLRVSLYFV